MKRKMQIDHMAEGLSSLGFMDILVTFIEKMQPLFVGGSNLPTCDELWNLLKINDHTSAEVTFSYLQRYVMQLDDCGKYIMRARYTCLYYIIHSWCRSKKLPKVLYRFKLCTTYGDGAYKSSLHSSRCYNVVNMCEHN